MVRIILALSLISSFSFAQDSVLLNVGDKATFQGWLSPSDKLNDYKLLTESLNKSIDLHKTNEDLLGQKIKVLSDDNDNLFKGLSAARSDSDIQKIVFFGSGVILTVLAIWAASKLRQ